MTNIILKIGAVAALLAALFFAEQYIERLGYDRAMLQAQAQIEGSKRAAADSLAQEIEKTRRAEQALHDAKNNQELKDATYQKTVSDLSDRLRRVAGPAGRLRDPHAAVGCGPSGGCPTGSAAPAAGGGAADSAQAGGLLSAQLDRLLQQLTREADDINIAYASCRADAYTVREPH
jgi:hypothetical protein